MLPDTLGVMSPQGKYSKASAICVGRYPGLAFDFHPHNDYGLATANAMMAVQAGARSIHVTVNCLGAGRKCFAGRSGGGLRDKLGMSLRLDESKIHALSQMVENFSGKRWRRIHRWWATMCLLRPADTR
ncbi:MAG: hypothetical protein Ct9H300mP14_16440 [Gammaproteobacteria bacterium]|nr:MAG: hypothetical protein Ct9H300mP14_16440 [Gammaproteobacteria bacterium]